jgi:hypothetical protein
VRRCNIIQKLQQDRHTFGIRRKAMAIPFPLPKRSPHSEGRDSCVSPAVSDNSSLYCFPEEEAEKPVRQPRMAPRFQPQVAGSEITNQHHTP